MSSVILPHDILSHAFETKEEKAAGEQLEQKRQARVDALVSRIFKSSPSGKKIVESAIARGITIGIDGDKGKTLGSYIRAMRRVSLNEKATDAELLATIVHECRHSEQALNHDHSNTVFACVSAVRALEADAMAHECAAVYQMRKAEPETYATFCKFHQGIMTAYETSFEKDKDEKKAKAEGFKAWYDDARYVERYDEKTVEFMAMGKMYAGAFKREIAPSYLSEKTGGYVDPEFFNSARATTAAETVVQAAAQVERNHIRHALRFFGRSKIKTSADRFYVRDEKGNVSVPRVSEKTKVAVAAKVGALGR